MEKGMSHHYPQKMQNVEPLPDVYSAGIVNMNIIKVNENEKEELIQLSNGARCPMDSLISFHYTSKCVRCKDCLCRNESGGITVSSGHCLCPRRSYVVFLFAEDRRLIPIHI